MVLQSEVYDYDVFISYSAFRDRVRARKLAADLTDRGYRVWFDEHVLDRRESWVLVDRRELLSLLGAAVRKSRVLAHYPIVRLKIPAPERLDKERAIAESEAIRARDDATALYAWNWQLYELSHARAAFEVKGDVVSVEMQLRENGVLPRVTGTSLINHLRRSLVRAYGILTRRKRIARLFEPTEVRRDGFNHDMYEARLRISAWTFTPSDEPYCFLVGPHGSGRTTALRDLAQRASNGWQRTPVFARLPDEHDWRHWLAVVAEIARTRTLLFDDVVEQVLSRPWLSSDHLFDLRAALNQNGGKAVFSGLESELNQLHEIITDNRSAREPVHIVRVNWDDEAKRNLVFAQCDELERTHGIAWESGSYWPYALSSILDRYPLWDGLRPPDYRTLSGRLSAPRNIVLFLDRLAGAARGPSGSRRVLRDHHIGSVLREATGLHPVLLPFTKHERPTCTELAEVLVDAPLHRLVVAKALESMTPPDWKRKHDDYPLMYFRIGSQSLRDDLSRRLAGVLFGSIRAVLRVTEREGAQRILDRLEVTEYAERSIARMPFWVVVIEGLTRSLDSSILSRLAIGDYYRTITSADGAEYEVSASSCIFVVDEVSSALIEERYDGPVWQL